jgi:hypothetical protein
MTGRDGTIEDSAEEVQEKDGWNEFALMKDFPAISSALNMESGLFKGSEELLVAATFREWIVYRGERYGLIHAGTRQGASDCEFGVHAVTGEMT